MLPVSRTMKKLCFLVLCLSLLAACQGVQQRGIANNAYVSTSRPALQVQVHGIPLLTAGAGTGRTYDNGPLGGLLIDTWVAVYASGPTAPMAAVIHAELPDAWQWTTVYPRGRAVDVRTEMLGDKAYAACTYLQPTAMDPFAGLAGEPTEIRDEANEEPRPAYWLVRSFAAIYSHTQEKIVLEYREPAPRELTSSLYLDDMPKAELAAFRERALKTFSLGLPDGSAVQTGYPDGVRWQYVSDAVLGPVMERNIAD